MYEYIPNLVSCSFSTVKPSDNTLNNSKLFAINHSIL